MEEPVKVKAITTAQAWRDAATQVVELPSGYVVRIRRLNLFALLDEGILPVLERMETIRKTVDGQDNQGILVLMTKDKALRDFIENLVVNGVVDPRFTRKDFASAAAEEVPLAALDSTDFLVLLNKIGELSNIQGGSPFFGQTTPGGSSSPGTILSTSTGSPSDTGDGPAS